MEDKPVEIKPPVQDRQRAICPQYQCDIGTDGLCKKCGAHRMPVGQIDPK